MPLKATGSRESGGIMLKQLRERRGLTLRNVEALSRQLAVKKQNQDFFVSRGWLNNVENGAYTPVLCKMYSLGAIYHIHWSSIFEYFGLRLSDFDRDQAMFAPARTELALEGPRGEEMVVLPTQAQRGLRLEQTGL